MSVKLINDGVHDTVASADFDLKCDLEKFKVEVIMKLPENEKDEKYKREFFRTSVDVAKFFNGVGGSNFIMKVIMETVLKSIDFEPKFPMKKVNTFKYKV